MAGFTKLFGSIVTSSIWGQDDKVLRVWIAMLAQCDSDGRVEGSIPGFAHLCRMTVSEFEAALQVLGEPDPYSRTPDNGGRRIEAIPGGWIILNHRVYRDANQAKNGSRAPYMVQYRASKKADVTSSTPEDEDVTSNPDTDTYTETESPSSSSGGDDAKPRAKKKTLTVGLNPEVFAMADRLADEWPNTRGDQALVADQYKAALRIEKILRAYDGIALWELEQSALAYLKYLPKGVYPSALENYFSLKGYLGDDPKWKTELVTWRHRNVAEAQPPAGGEA